MGQLDRDGAAAAGFNLGGLAFLDVHGDMAHRSYPNVLVVLLCPLEAIFNGADRRGRVGGRSVVLALETVGEERNPAALLYGLLHVALEVVRAGGTSHDGGSHCPVARTVLAHHVGLALPGTVADTANDVVLQHGALVRHIAVRIGDRDDAVLLLDLACDSLLRRSFFTAHVLTVGVAVACDFMTVLGHVAETAGTLTARLCLNGSEDKCKVQTFDRLRSIISTDIIMMSAWLTTVDGASQLNVKVWPGSWAGNLDADQVSFALTDSEIPGVTATAQNEYVGYSLADQNFKLYGIGWRSYTYNAQCWDAPPSISCSFKAAYTGGIVPLNTAVTPWIGFSAWYNDAHVDGCSPVYYYNGNDDGGCVISVDDTDYKKCGSNYQFTEAGAHGYTNNETNQEVKTAKAGVENCYVVGPAAAWASQGVADHCGAFWVGDMNECSRNVTFVFTLNGAEGSYYSVDGTANVREADLKVTLNNPAGDEVEIYLYSINTEERYSYGASQPIYSIPYTTTSNGAITIPVKNLSNVDGFDPERVGGVYVKTSGSASVTSVESACANVVAINSCSAAYDKTAGKWKISTVVNSYTHAKKIKVTESSSHITNGEAECDETTACAWSGVSGRTATNMLPIDDANPYAGSGVRSYTFTVTMTTDDNETLTCETEPVDVSGTEGVCGSLTGANPIKQGAGLPVFSYGISNCPNNNCGYKVLLSDGTEIVASTTSGDGTWNTDANAANKTTSLEPGDYYFTLQSTDNPASFTSCNSETFKVTDSKVTASCSFDNSTIYLGQQASFSASSFSVQNENIAIDFLDPNNQSLETNSSFYANNTYTKSVTPTTTGALTYTLLANGGVACTATLTVNPPSASCSLSSENVEEGDDLTLTVSSIAPASANVDIAVTENTNHKTGANSHWSNNSYTPQWTMWYTGKYHLCKILEACPGWRNSRLPDG